MAKLIVRPTASADIDALLRLQAQVYPSIAPWKRDQLAHQLELFPQGQLVAELDGRLVGCASSLVILWDEWAEEHTWSEITASGTFDTHTPQGLTLYGAEVFVDPRLRGKRVGHLLYEGRRKLCKQLNLRRIIACGRLPGYARVADQMPIELYARKVLWGDLFDPVLSFQLREGFRYCGIMKNYLPDDHESSGHASLIVWINPDYDPSQGTALQRAASGATESPP
ncbi:MAG: GNAT family N-acetyltransferase [Hydrogenophaga sp.]|uniref:GNAT family N-acetyltransferase n=1 Tax=Hydrogenophaga sp. TaxID=1904254 RepID=UPI001D2AA666|nr:GNAT family N-acetyltransferase [Hydrogenophaga sp.]MBX3611459.1 GNAT family N-acetyltransferase [Hydrogenophaga sp.]